LATASVKTIYALGCRAAHGANPLSIQSLFRLTRSDWEIRGQLAQYAVSGSL
jgi:hypothetical protein